MTAVLFAGSVFGGTLVCEGNHRVDGTLYTATFTQDFSLIDPITHLSLKIGDREPKETDCVEDFNGVLFAATCDLKNNETSGNTVRLTEPNYHTMEAVVTYYAPGVRVAPVPLKCDGDMLTLSLE